MKKTFLLLLIGVITLTFGCQMAFSQKLDQSQELDDGIASATLDQVGMEDNVIQEIVDSIAAGYFPNRHSLLIYKNDKLVSEDYFTGQDFNWGRDIGVVTHTDSTLHDMRSVSKSVVSACIGIAISRGEIKGVDQEVFDFFKDLNQYKNQGREVLTIKHLLTMTSGLEWNEELSYDNPLNSESQMDKRDDPIAFVLSREVITTPGTKWRYNGGTTEVLAHIIKRVTGKNIYEYAQEFLFKPLGITNSAWTNSRPGNPAAPSGLRLTSRDMLKFGSLYLNNGEWHGKQIIPKEWVEASLKSSVNRPGGGGYGYQFWVFNYTVQGKHLTIPAAVGNGDQRIYIDKSNALLVVTTAGNYNMWDIVNNASLALQSIYNSFKISSE